MLQAINSKTHRLVLAVNADHDEQYHCPECQESLILRHGNATIPHFAHHPGSQCVLGAGETNEHLQGKQQIYDWAEKHGWQPTMELYLPQIQQRPDVLIKVGNRQIALEFQCSPLSLLRLNERNNGYRQLDIKFRWLLGSPYLRKLHAGKVAQFTQLVRKQPMLLYWNIKSNRVEHVDCRRVSLITKGTGTPRQIIIKQTKQIQFHLRRRDQHWRKLAMAAYQQRHLLAACPLVAHDCVKRWPVIQGSIVEWRIWILLDLEHYPLGYCWPGQKWWQWLLQKGQWLPFPCLNDNGASLVEEVLKDFTNDLVKEDLIDLDQSAVKLKKYPVWFPSLETKLGRLYSSQLRL